MNRARPHGTIRRVYWPGEMRKSDDVLVIVLENCDYQATERIKELFKPGTPAELELRHYGEQDAPPEDKTSLHERQEV